MIHAYNCTKHEATGYTPYHLLFGRTPCLPIHLAFNLNQDFTKGEYNSYVQNWQHDMKDAYQIGQRNAKKTAERGKQYYNKKVSGGVFQSGDQVLVRNLTEQGGRGKLRFHWEHLIHIVVDWMRDQSPVYKVKLESRGGHTTVLHWNLRLPCVTLELDAPNLGFGTQPWKSIAEKRPLSLSGDEFQSSGKEEEDDFGSMDFVEETPSEVRASKPVSPEQDLPSDSVKNQATTEGTNGPSGETQLANEECQKWRNWTIRGGGHCWAGCEDSTAAPEETTADPNLQLKGRSTVPVCWTSSQQFIC